MENNEKICRCCICGQLFMGMGNNPWPVIDEDDASCCDLCNQYIVVPARIEMILVDKEHGKEQSK